jgi:hypothetical protein
VTSLAAVAIVTAGGAAASSCAAVAAAAISCAVVVVAAATPAAATAPSSVARPAAVAATATSCAIVVIAAAATAATCRTGRHADARGWTGHCARWHGCDCGHGPSRRGVRRTRRCSSGEHGRGDGEQRGGSAVGRKGQGPPAAATAAAAAAAAVTAAAAAPRRDTIVLARGHRSNDAVHSDGVSRGEGLLRSAAGERP